LSLHVIDLRIIFEILEMSRVKAANVEY